MNERYRLHALAFLGLATLTAYILVKYVQRGSFACFAPFVISAVHMTWIVVAKLTRQHSYAQHHVLHDALCIYGSLLCLSATLHLEPLSSPPSALIGGSVHSLLGTFIGKQGEGCERELNSLLNAPPCSASLRP